MSVSNKNLLAIPIILSIALLLGVRGIVNVPLASEANWIFRFTEGEIKRHYFIGLKKGITVFAILPLFGVLCIFFAFFWGWVYALMHCLYGLAAALVLMEILFWRYAKIPFACLTVPGKAKLHMLWWVYGGAILIFTSLLSRVEKSLFTNLSHFWAVIGAGFIIVFFLEVCQHLFIYGKVQIVYEEEPEPVLIGLDPTS
jgi:hypothetical protein